MATQALVERAAPTICGRALGRARHACAFVSSSEEAMGILMPFAREGVERGERVMQIVGDEERAAHEERVRGEGPDWARALARDQLTVLGWRDAYLKDGYFDPHRMLKMLEDFLADRRARGFPLARGMATMEWAAGSEKGVEHLLEYEARANILCASHPDAFLCAYDTTRFPASVVIDILRVHPVAIVGGVAYENPYYVQPETMLNEIEARRR